MPTKVIDSPANSSSGPALRDQERTRCEVWSRVMGYHRPVSSWNLGKQGEFHERRYFRADHGRA
jgi:hypothetical protein